MAISTQYTKTLNTPSEKLDTNELHGRVRVAFADFTAEGAEETTVSDTYLRAHETRHDIV